MNKSMKFISIFLVFIILIVGQGNNVRANSVVTQWNNLVLDSVKVARTPPTLTARILYIVHQAIYDAWSVYDNVALCSRYADQFRRPSSERTLDNKNKAISYAAFTAYNDLYPQFLANSTALMNSLGYNPIDTAKSFTTASGIGITVAYNLIQYRHGDGSNQLGDLNPGNYSDCTNYVPTNTPSQLNDPNLWQPLLVNNNTQRYTTPHWYTVQTFANEIWPNITAAPYKYPSDGYTKQAEEILAYYANLTDVRKVVAEYWAGGPGTVTPPGIWNQYAQFVSNRDSYDVDRDTKLFFLLNAALMDASIVCWGVKRYYNSVRPISAIRFLYNGKTIRSWVPGGEVKDISGETWFPFQESNFVTPAFPSFTSGHSTFSGAAAQVLRQFTGSDNFGFSYTFKARTSIIEPTAPSQDVTLTYSTFTDAANDAGISRLYGGIHFQADNTNGLYAGKVVAQNVMNKGLKLINGTSFLIPQSPSPSPSSSSTLSLSFFCLFIIQIIILVLRF